MAITEAFPGPSAVVDSLELRKNLAGLIVRDTAGVPRAGVFPRHTGSLVTSTATMSVNVAAFEAALVRTGPLFIQNDGTVAVAIATAPVSNSRIDVVWVRQQENGYNGFADGSNTPLISVTAGTAAASPVKPAIPAGALELATVLVPAGATATNSGGVIITQTFPYTATSGGVVLLRNSTEEAAWTPVQGSGAYRLDTGVPLTRTASGWIPPRRIVESAPGAVVFGPIPPVGTPLIEWQTVVNVATNASGFASIAYPAGLFPNGIVSVQLQRHNEGSGYGPMFQILTASAAQSLTQLNFRIYVSGGAPIGAFSGIPYIVNVVGW